MPKAGALTAKQAAFVAEYLVDKNATQAAIRAGYSTKTAEWIGPQLLGKTHVSAAIAAGLEKQAAGAEITAERILRERARLAFSDSRKLMHEDGRIKLPHELDEDTAAAIVSFKVDTEGRIEYKLAGKDPSLAALEKRYGLNEKPTSFALPSVADVVGCGRAQEAVIQAVAKGVLLPSEGEALAGLLEGRRRALEATELADRLAAIEQQIGITKGQPHERSA